MILPNLQGSLLREPTHAIQLKLSESLLKSLIDSPSLSIKLDGTVPSLEYGNGDSIRLSITPHGLSDLVYQVGQELKLCKIQSIAKVIATNPSVPSKKVSITQRVIKTTNPEPIPPPSSKRTNLLQGEKERKKRKLQSSELATPSLSIAATPISSPKTSKKDLKSMPSSQLETELKEKVEKKVNKKYEFTDSEPEEGEVPAAPIKKEVKKSTKIPELKVASPPTTSSKLSKGLIEFYSLEYSSTFSTYSALQGLLSKEKEDLNSGKEGNLGLAQIKELVLKLGEMREKLLGLSKLLE